MDHKPDSDMPAPGKDVSPSGEHTRPSGKARGSGPTEPLPLGAVRAERPGTAIGGRKGAREQAEDPAVRPGLAGDAARRAAPATKAESAESGAPSPAGAASSPSPQESAASFRAGRGAADIPLARPGVFAPPAPEKDGAASSRPEAASGGAGLPDETPMPDPGRRPAEEIPVAAGSGAVDEMTTAVPPAETPPSGPAAGQGADADTGADRAAPRSAGRAPDTATSAAAPVSAEPAETEGAAASGVPEISAEIAPEEPPSADAAARDGGEDAGERGAPFAVPLADRPVESAAAPGTTGAPSASAGSAGAAPSAEPTAPSGRRRTRSLAWRLSLGLLVGLGRFFGWFFGWLTLGFAMAAFGLGALFWMYAQGLPDVEQLKNYRPPTISQIYSSEGELIDEFARERRIFTPIEEIPDQVKWAFISAEDKNFYRHRGYDPIGIVKALIDAARGKRLRGASTITQQVMKNFLLDGTRSAERKVKEIILASRLEKALPKDKILELYLNEIFLGQNSYGVTAAAQTYFNKPLEELSLAEVAYLAALPKAPSQYHPVRQYDRAVARRNYVLKEMADNGYVPREAAEAAMKEPLRTVQNGDYPSYRENMPPRDYFTDEIRRQLSADFGADDFFTGGYRIRATKDPRLQKVAARALRHQLEAYDRRKGLWRGPVARVPREALAHESAWREALDAVKAPRDIDGWHLAVVLTSGRKLARIGVAGMPADPERDVIPFDDIRWARPVGRNGKAGPKPRRVADLLRPGDVIFVRKADRKGREPAPGAPFDHWSLRQIPEIEGAFVAMDAETGRVLAMQGGFSYQQSVFNRATQARRQPGSAFKPFVYAAALDSGYTPATIVIDAPIEVETPEGIWRPKNSSNKFYGPAPLRTGIVYSRNLMTVRLARAVGLDRVAEHAERFGVYDDMKPHLANALGAQETTLFRMVSAYAMFANGGLRVEPTLVDRVQDRWGRTVYRHDRRECLDCARRDLPEGVSPRIREVRQRVLDPITAYELTSMMQDVVRRGTAAGRVTLDVPVAGKTGTTNEARDVWFIGFTSRLVAGCYIGYDIPKPLGRGAYGGSMCAPVFNEFMQEAVKLYPSGPFPVPPDGVFVKIDRRTGARLPDDATGDNVVSELFRPGEEPAFGASDVIDGGFAMGSDLPLFAPGEEPGAESGQIPVEAPPEGENVPGTGFGSLSAGGLY